MSNQPVERDTQLLSVGTQCSAPSCLLVDFLPFKCQHCNKPYCADHFTVEGHKCDQYDEHKHNRVAPSCPFCSEPVAIPPGQDPNIRMEVHIEQECTVLTGKAKKKSAPTCANKKCSKVLFAPIRCDKCRQQFCPAHRFPSDHSCVANASAQQAPKPTLANTATNLNTKVSAASGAMKQKLAATATQAKSAAMSASASKPAPPSGGPSKPSLPGPFNKTDRSPSLPLSESPIPAADVKSAAPPVINPLAFKPPSIFGLA